MKPLAALALSLLAAALSSCASTPSPSAGGEVLHARLFIVAPYEQVWRAFTVAERYADWHTTPCRHFGTQPGNPLVWGDADRAHYEGRLVEMDRGRLLEHTFRFVGYDFNEPDTYVRIRIEQRGPTVLIDLEHDCTGAPETARMISPVGWPKSLSRLKTLLETGEAMPWPQ